MSKSAFYSSLRSTSIFGGVQAFNIVIQILRTKAAGIFLGAQGMGLMAILNTTVQLIVGLTNFGLNTAGVQKISESSGNDEKEVQRIIGVIQVIIWLSAIFGALICFFGAGILSQSSFNNSEYAGAFMMLSVSIIFAQLTNGKTIVFQGLKKYRIMAYSSVIGNTLGLIITLPLYYLYGVDSVVYVLIIANIVTYVVAEFLSRSRFLLALKTTMSDLVIYGTPLIRLGFALSIQSILTLLSSYLIQIWILKVGGLEDVGFYNAGLAMVNTYVGMVFTAMATDYFPRLTSVFKIREERDATINNQAIIALLLVAPIVLVFISFSELFIRILYTSEFLVIAPMLYWSIAGVLFKCISWSVSYSFLASGDGRLFLKHEAFATGYNLAISLIFYSFFGLTGLGIGFFLVNAAYLFHMIFVANRRLEIAIHKDIWRMFIVSFLLVLASLLSSFAGNILIVWVLQGLIIFSSLLYSYQSLRKNIDIYEIEIFRKLKRIIGKK